MEYLKRLYWVLAATDFAVVFLKTVPSATGYPGTSAYLRHADGTVDATFDPARHVRRLSRPSTAIPAAQAFAIPKIAVTDPTVSAVLFLMNTDGSIGAPISTLSNIDLMSVGAPGEIGVA